MSGLEIVTKVTMYLEDFDPLLGNADMQIGVAKCKSFGVFDGIRYE